MVLTFAPVLVDVISPTQVFHQYSIGRENTGSGFTGAHTWRLDRPVSGLPNTGCSFAYTGNPVYQPIWATDPSPSHLSWREVGTGHQCGDNFRYWYWGYGYQGQFTSLGIQSGISNGQYHTFEFHRKQLSSGYYYYFLVDGMTKATLKSTKTFPYVETGLESYASGASVSRYAHRSLKYQKLDGPMVPWSGRDYAVVHSQMCGTWLADDSRQVGQGSGC
jgi:hypothetical protein